MWLLTVLRLMYSSSAISLLVRPPATASRTCPSLAVSGSPGCGGLELRRVSVKDDRSRRVVLGAIRASPRAAAWIAWVSSSGPASLSRKPRAPAFNAP